MVVRIRLARHGAKRLPLFHIVVANARSRRNGKPIEKLGHFSPHPDLSDRTKHIALDFERTKYWLGVGAQPSDTVAYLLEKVLDIDIGGNNATKAKCTEI
ncbi:37S ribosomal protein S16, mitochondrial [Mycoemilia scoparia]|uniref:37S ribosomal protein S16, mitochondrial n=1 Tax=Mycoemilia scoparia TaxID=417184 RepID=A0A9W8A1P4_9FUNG|nr:37S ribosomal protein S16, mitochondrial [Mycoemilia scoparia]